VSSLYYLLTTLPQLPELGGAPAIPFAELQRIVQNDGYAAAVAVVDVLALERQVREAIDRRVLESATLDNDTDFPAIVQEALASDPVAMGEDEWLDRVWSAYFTHVHAVGRKVHAPLLSKWAKFEPDLREHLAALRRGDKHTPGPFDMLMDIVGCNNPMDAEIMLDTIRWRFLEKETPRFTFHIDELVAYALKHRLLERYVRLDRAKGTTILEEVTTL